MKNLNFILMLCCVASVFFVGCLDPNFACRNVECGANGACLEGLCDCSDGYEGEKCDTLSFHKFIGRWKGQETHVYNSVMDTINIDWTAQVSTKPTELKITAANGTVSILKLKGNNLTVQNEIVLDSLHIINRGAATINTAKTQINYQFDYKQIGTNAAFYGRGILLKQ